jgi:alkanesulfonate monooxygenase SsuD/methylene tetrahydromethanopterin reductase-like flavin-dependent oxidoreductase (luciferase family)
LTFIEDSGIMLEPQEGMGLEELLDVAKLVEKSGYGYLFRSDHVLPTSKKKGLDSPECWVTLGAIAATTKKVRFGPMVSPIGFRNPAFLARMARTVDAISSGRLQLGVGAGWYKEEYLAHGFVFPSVKVRKEQFREGLEIIRPLMQQGAVSFDGKYFSAHLEGLPKPRHKVHMIIGGKMPSIVRETLKYADEWNYVGAPPAEFESLKRALRASRRHIIISKMGQFIIGENRQGLRAAVKAEMKRQGVNKDEGVFTRELVARGCPVATSSDFADDVNRLRDAGVERIYFQTWNTRNTNQIDLLAGVLKGL